MEQRHAIIICNLQMVDLGAQLVVFLRELFDARKRPTAGVILSSNSVKAQV